MAYTLIQARKLLSSAELTVFEASRPKPLRELSPARLRSMVERTRKLRDKNQDLYRRQTVATRTAPASRRSATGGDNQRTRQKAELFGEVLARYETELKRVDAAAKAAAKAAERATRLAAKEAARDAAKQARESARQAKAAARDAKASGAGKGTKAAGTRAAAGSRAATGPGTTTGIKTASGTSSAKETRRATGAKKATGTGRKLSLKAAVADALEQKQAALEVPAKRAVRKRSPKAPTTTNGQGADPSQAGGTLNAPLDVVAEAKRQNPLRQVPANKKIHAHQRSQGRRVQARRDAR